MKVSLQKGLTIFKLINMTLSSNNMNMSQDCKMLLFLVMVIVSSAEQGLYVKKLVLALAGVDQWLSASLRIRGSLV